MNRRTLIASSLLLPFCHAAVALARQPQAARPPRDVQAWRRQLMAALQRRKRYPAALTLAAKASGQPSPSGKAELGFTLDREGRVLSASITRSSGIPELDAAALAMARPGSHLPKPPADLPDAAHEVRVPVVFVGGPASTPGAAAPPGRGRP